MTSKIKAVGVDGIEINVGDTVAVVCGVDRLTVGKNYTVKSISGNGAYVRVICDDGLVDGWDGGVFRVACPEAFADDLVTAEWRSGDPDEKLTELLRVAEMEGAHVTATRYGATRSGNVHHVERSVRIHLGIFSGAVVIDLRLGGWTITVTAPKPMRPGADIPDEVVGAAMGVLYDVGDGDLPTNEAMRAALAAAGEKLAELEAKA